MAENGNESKGPRPDFRGKLDVAAWQKKDKNGNLYLSLKIGSYVNLFKNERKDELEDEEIGGLRFENIFD